MTSINGLATCADNHLEIEMIEGFVINVQVYLHEIMVRKGISRAELARGMGVSRARVRKMFSDDHNLTARQLACAAHHLGEWPRVESETTRALRAEREADQGDTAIRSRHQRTPVDPTVSMAAVALITVIDIPVDYGRIGVRRALATMVVDVAAEAIVGIALSASMPNPTPTATALLDAFRHDRCIARALVDQTRVGIVALYKDEGGATAESLRRAGFSANYLMTHAHGGGMIIEALLGREHAGLRLRQRLVWNSGNRRLAAPRPVPAR